MHGLGSVFSSGQPLICELSVRLTRAGVGYFKFNTRGHDVVAGRGRTLAGAAFERFRDCVLDLRAVIAFARRRGYRRIVLAGHSTGANKVLYYAAKTADRRVTGLILLGPISDIAGEAKRIGRRELGRRVARASRLAARDRRALVPSAWGFWSARRYLSLYRPGEAEDVFPYDRPAPVDRAPGDPRACGWVGPRRVPGPFPEALTRPCGPGRAGADSSRPHHPARFTGFRGARPRSRGPSST